MHYDSLRCSRLPIGLCWLFHHFDKSWRFDFFSSLRIVKLRYSLGYYEFSVCWYRRIFLLINSLMLCIFDKFSWFCLDSNDRIFYFFCSIWIFFSIFLRFEFCMFWFLLKKLIQNFLIFHFAKHFEKVPFICEQFWKQSVLILICLSTVLWHQFMLNLLNFTNICNHVHTKYS